MATISEQLQKVKDSEGLDEKKKEYDSAPNKTPFVIKNFGEYIGPINGKDNKMKLVEQISSFLNEYGAKDSSSKELTSKVLDDKEKNVFTDIMYDDEPMAVTGGKLKDSYSALLNSTIIDKDKIKAKNPKARVKSMKDTYLRAKSILTLGKDLTSQDKNFMQNLVNIYEELEDDANLSLDSEFIEGVEVTDLDFTLSDFFGSSSLRQLHKRNNIYKYWKGIDGKFDKLIKLLREPKNEELAEGINVNKLNYVVKYDPVKVTLANVEFRAKDFIDNFFEIVTGDTSIVNYDEVDGEYYFSEKDIKTEEGTKGQFAEIDESKITSKEYKKIMSSPVEMDVLGYIYIMANLGESGAAISGAEKKLLQTSVRKTLKSIVAFEEEDLSDFVEGIEDFLKQIEVVKKLNEAYLPIYFTESKESIMDFSNVNYQSFRDLGDAIGPLNIKSVDDVTKNIDKLFNNIRKVIIEELGAQPSLISEEGLGASKGAPKQDMKEPAAYQNYIRGQEAKYKEIDDNVKEVLDLVDELFIKPRDSRYSKGLSFRYDENRLSDVINRPNSPFKIQSQLTKNAAKEGIDFINLEELQEIEELMLSIKTIQMRKYKTPTNIQKLKEDIESMIGVLNGILDTSEDMQDSYKDDVTKDLASLFYAVTEKDINLEGFNTKKEFESRGVSDYDDASALKQIINFIVKNENNFKMPDLKDEYKVVKKIIETRNWFSNFTKSDSQMLLQAHDHIRILKGQDTYYNFLDNEDIDSVAYFINKMSDERNIDLSSMEVDNIIKSVDSFANISEEHGISTEDVYLVKAHFR